MELTLSCEIKEKWEVLPVRHLRAFLPQLVEEGVDHCLYRTQSCLRRIFQQLRHQVNGFWGRSGPEDLKK